MNKYKTKSNYLNPLQYKWIDRIYQTIKLKRLTMKASKLEKKLRK